MQNKKWCDIKYYWSQSEHEVQLVPPYNVKTVF
jgi:hypothetical protein